MKVAFVCTGNTCRSPMAQAIFTQKTKNLSQSLEVISCGLAASTGAPASDNAVLAMKSVGIDISGHRARTINKYIIEQADKIVCLSKSHYDALYPFCRDKLLLLGEGVDDPYGGDEEEYKSCAEQIGKAIDVLLDSDAFIELDDLKQGDISLVAQAEQEAFSHPRSEKAIAEQLSKDYSLSVVLRYLGEAKAYILTDAVIDEVFVGSLAVKEQFRKRGFGKKLMAYLVERSEKIGARLITLEVRPSNIPALRLYSDFGFEVTGRRKNFYSDPKEDAYIMTKYLGGGEDENTGN